MDITEQYSKKLSEDPINFIKTTELSAQDFIELSKSINGITIIRLFFNYKRTSILLKAKDDFDFYKVIKNTTYLIPNEKLPLDFHLAAQYWFKNDKYQPYKVDGNDLIFDITQNMVRPKEVRDTNKKFTDINALKSIDVYEDGKNLTALIDYLITFNVYSYDTKEIVFNQLLSSQNVPLIELFSTYYAEEFSFHLWAFPCQIDYLKTILPATNKLWNALKKHKQKELIEYEESNLRIELANF
jgi:hypothetical protein